MAGADVGRAPAGERIRRQSIDVLWYLRIVLFFAVMTLALTAITYLVNLYSVPASAYELDGSSPQTIVLATFVNGTLEHLESNLYAMAFLLMGVLVLPVVDAAMMESRRFLLLVTWGQVAAGLVGALGYYVLLAVRGAGLDGAARPSSTPA